MDPCGSFWWRDIYNLSPEFRGIARCNIVAGDSILFWKDPWMDQPASMVYPRAFSYAINEDVSAKDFLTANTLGENFQLPLSAQAIQELRSAQEETAEILLDTHATDQWS